MTQNTTARPLPPSPGNLFSASLRRSRLIPGLPLSLGYTLFYLSALVLIPLGGMVFKTAQLSASEFWQTITDPIVVASFKLTFGASALAAIINGVFGLIVAWVLVREPFPRRRIFDALIDFPFALPSGRRSYLQPAVSTRWLDRRFGASHHGPPKFYRSFRRTTLCLRRTLFPG
jgi:ABC-type spermidine/putrescine transport system permease subunit I